MPGTVSIELILTVYNLNCDTVSQFCVGVPLRAETIVYMYIIHAARNVSCKEHYWEIEVAASLRPNLATFFVGVGVCTQSDCDP